MADTTILSEIVDVVREHLTQSLDAMAEVINKVVNELEEMLANLEDFND